MDAAGLRPIALTGGRPCGRLRIGAGAVVAALLAVTPAPGATLDYLYIEANEGGSSGGHVALGIGDDVYHFQHDTGGVLALRRDPRSCSGSATRCCRIGRSMSPVSNR